MRGTLTNARSFASSLKCAQCSRAVARASVSSMTRSLLRPTPSTTTSTLLPSRPFSHTPLNSSSDTNRFTASDPDERTYHTVADETMEDLLVYFEELTEKLGMESGADVEYSSGVLNLIIKEGMTYVLNKQPPNKQIWLSSPVSGPKRYDYDVKHAAWFYHRDGTTLKELLDAELAEITGEPVNVPLSV